MRTTGPHAELDYLVEHLAAAAQLLFAITPSNAQSERVRLEAAYRARTPLKPAWTYVPICIPAGVHRAIDRARGLASEHPLAQAYGARLDEIELDLAIIRNVGTRDARSLARRRFGRGANHDEYTAWLTCSETSIKSQDSADLCNALQTAGDALGFEFDLVYEPNLASHAATSSNRVWYSQAQLPAQDVLRLAVHEIAGHMLARRNARQQPYAILRVGTARSFRDQEGLCLLLEEHAGLLDAKRKRTLAARALAAQCAYDEADFEDTVLFLCREGLTIAPAIRIAERAFRGGCVARDAAYVDGYLRVKSAAERDAHALHRLSRAAVCVDDARSVLEAVTEPDGVVGRASYDPTAAATVVADAVRKRAVCSAEVGPSRRFPAVSEDRGVGALSNPAPRRRTPRVA